MVGEKQAAKEGYPAHTCGEGSAACQVSGQVSGAGLYQAEGISWLKSKRKRELGALGQLGGISHCSETP